MAAHLAHVKKSMNRTFSKKSYSWWWDSHISPKNSKWLAENLEEMDQSVKRMLKLIEEDGDSFAKKAEMYYQKRPELISQVEEFYRVYRSLAERYDHVTGELRKNVVSDLQSQGSAISEVGSELGSVPPSPDQRHRRKLSANRAAGFDVFLGSGGSQSDLYNKDGDELSSSLDSDSESDDSSSVNNYSGLQVNVGEPELRRKLIVLEMELNDTKEKLRMQEAENLEGSSNRGANNGNCEELLAKISGFEEELRRSYEEISGLRIKLSSLESTNGSHVELESDIKEETEVPQLHEKVSALAEELQLTKEKLEDSEKEMNSLRNEYETNKSDSIRRLQEQLDLAKKDGAMWISNLNTEKREVSKLQERIARYKTNLAEREQEIRQIKVAVSDAEQIFSVEKEQLEINISKLSEEKTCLEKKLEEWDQKGKKLEEDIKIVEASKAEMESMHEANEKRLRSEIELLKLDLSERSDNVKDLNTTLDALKHQHDALTSERDELNTKLDTLLTDMRSKDEKIGEMEKHWHQLHIEQAELMVGTEKAHKVIETLTSRVNDLEKEVDRQTILITESAEEKREAIRQLCFSIDHYRHGYQTLRQAFVGHKRPTVLAR